MKGSDKMKDKIEINQNYINFINYQENNLTIIIYTNIAKIKMIFNNERDFDEFSYMIHDYENLFDFDNFKSYEIIEY